MTSHDSKLKPILLALTSAALALTLAGCKSNPAAPPAVATTTAQDPAAANIAGGTTQVLGQSESAPTQQQAQAYDTDPSVDQGYNNGETPGQAIAEQPQAPPPLQSTDQPPAPGPNYIWTPGYWGNGPSGYVWVNGNWARPPYSGALWTPPYWGYTNSRYRFHQGYWGRHVGFYGGVDYGNGYIGTGYYGGYWQGENFYYNRHVNHLGAGINFAYDRPVFYGGINYGFGPHIGISFNGGPGGINYGPRPYELAAMREEHRAPYGVQLEGFHNAGGVYRGGGINEHVEEVHDRNAVRQEDHRDMGHAEMNHNNGHAEDHGGNRGGDHGGGHPENHGNENHGGGGHPEQGHGGGDHQDQGHGKH